MQIRILLLYCENVMTHDGLHYCIQGASSSVVLIMSNSTLTVLSSEMHREKGGTLHPIAYKKFSQAQCFSRAIGLCASPLALLGGVVSSHDLPNPFARQPELQGRP